jgi:hypothetical protein
MLVEAKREGGPLYYRLGEVGGIQLGGCMARHQQDQYMMLSNIGTAASQSAGLPCPGTEVAFHGIVQQMCQVQNAARPMGDDCGTEAQGRALGQRSVDGRNGESREPSVVQRCTLQPLGVLWRNSRGLVPWSFAGAR